jgi:hypothetical protein
MESLQTLNVELNLLSAVLWEGIDKETVTRFVLPIIEVVRPKEFILSLSFPAQYSSPPEDIDKWGDLPCTIRCVQRESEL